VVDLARDAWWPGGVALAVLSLLFMWVSGRTREPGLSAFAVAFALAATLYLVKNWLLGDYERGTLLGVALSGLAGIAMLVGVCMYTNDRQHSPWKESLKIGAIWLGVTASLRYLDVLAPLTEYVSTSLLMLMLFALAVRAAKSEPGMGFEVIAAVFLIQPATLVAAYYWGLPPIRVRLITWVPFCIAGMTLLVVAQLRAKERLKQELRARIDAEEALRRANENLEEKVRLRTAELRGVVEGLESFSRMVSHDLRGPLAGISGLADVALEAAEAGRLEKLVEMLRLISRQGRTSAELVTSLLRLARASDGEVGRSTVDLSVIVLRAIEQVRISRVEAEKVKWSLAPLPRVLVDATLVEQVFVNLITNAVKFSSGVDSPLVEVGVQPRFGYTFFVRDNGVGLNSSSSKLFEPFARQHGAAFDGHGIGLSIVRRIVERHGGNIWCESSPGQGATFYFTLGACTDSAQSSLGMPPLSGRPPELVRSGT
jgi:signal transduction histidine kinase